VALAAAVLNPQESALDQAIDRAVGTSVTTALVRGAAKAVTLATDCIHLGGTGVASDEGNQRGLTVVQGAGHVRFSLIQTLGDLLLRVKKFLSTFFDSAAAFYAFLSMHAVCQASDHGVTRSYAVRPVAD
jgi:hypothetical protein